MGVLGDVFEGEQGAKAAEAQRSYLNLVKAQTMPVLENAYGSSLGFVAGGANQARDALRYGYGEGTLGIRQGEADALASLRTGSGQAMGYLDAAKGAYDPLTALGGKYGGATNLALGALGVNGAQGQADARSAFQAGPGYNFNLDQGLDAINRRRAAGGMLNSGNADRDAQTFGAGLASQEYDKWMQSLLGFTNPELAATSGAATGLAGLGRDQATLANSTGVAAAGLNSQRGSMLAQLADRYGTNTANVGMTEGKSLADLSQAHANQIMGLNLNIAPQFNKTYTDEAAARTAGSANIISAGMQAAKALSGSGFNPFSLGSLGGSGNGDMFPSSNFLTNGMSWG